MKIGTPSTTTMRPPIIAIASNAISAVGRINWRNICDTIRDGNVARKRPISVKYARFDRNERKV